MRRYDSYKDSGVAWIGEIPEHWEIRSLRNFLSYVSIKGHGDKQLLSVTRENGVIVRNVESKEENHNFVPDDLSGYKLVEEGHFVINKMKSWQGSYGVSSYTGIVSPAYYVCNLRFENKRFFNIAIRSKSYVPFFTQYSKGIRVDQWDLPPIALKNIPFIVPPLDEQQNIVEFLDEKTTKIDTYIQEKEKEICSLEELKQAEIAFAVTHGINPDAPMKDSGIAWIGEIPEHWEIRSLRNFLSYVSIKGHGDKQLLSVTRENGVIVRNVESKEENHNFVPDDLSGYKLVEEGHFVINKMKSWQGSYGVSSYTGIVSPAYYVCNLRFENKRFFNIAIRSKSYVPFFTQYSKGIRVDQWDLPPIALKNIPFIVPPLDEQQQIVEYIQQKTAQIDKYIADAKRQIDSLKEYRQRLICDAVTGRINVQPKL